MFSPPKIIYFTLKRVFCFRFLWNINTFSLCISTFISTKNSCNVSCSCFWMTDSIYKYHGFNARQTHHHVEYVNCFNFTFCLEDLPSEKQERHLCNALAQKNALQNTTCHSKINVYRDIQYNYWYNEIGNSRIVDNYSAVMCWWCRAGQYVTFTRITKKGTSLTFSCFIFSF